MMNGVLWRVRFVNPRSRMLIDQAGKPRLASTDPISKTIYLSRSLNGDMLVTVLLHEIGHCVIFSYGLLDEIHEAVRPEYWPSAEEWICNLIADYGRDILAVAKDIMTVPHELDKLLA